MAGHAQSADGEMSFFITHKGGGDGVNFGGLERADAPCQSLAEAAGGNITCGNWTSNGEGSAIVGHHDRVGLSASRNMMSWNAAHGSAGCGQDDLPRTGGLGLL